MTANKEDELRAMKVDLQRAAAEAVHAVKDSYKVTCANLPGYKESRSEEHVFNELIETMIKYYENGTL